MIFTFELYYSLHAGPSRVGCCPRVSPMSRSHPARDASLLMMLEVGTTSSYLLGSVLLSHNHSVNPKRSRPSGGAKGSPAVIRSYFFSTIHHHDTSPESLFSFIDKIFILQCVSASLLDAPSQFRAHGGLQGRYQRGVKCYMDRVECYQVFAVSCYIP